MVCTLGFDMATVGRGVHCAAAAIMGSEAGQVIGEGERGCMPLRSTSTPIDGSTRVDSIEGFLLLQLRQGIERRSKMTGHVTYPTRMSDLDSHAQKSQSGPTAKTRLLRAAEAHHVRCEPLVVKPGCGTRCNCCRHYHRYYR